MIGKLIGAGIICALSIPAFAQQTGSLQPARAVQGSSKIRLFVSDSESWEVSGGFGASNGSGGGAERGGARPQTAEIIKTVGEKCPEITVTMAKEKADYVLLLDHEGGKGVLRKDTKLAVFKSDGDSIFSASTRSVGGGVKDACSAILKDAK